MMTRFLGASAIVSFADAHVQRAVPAEGELRPEVRAAGAPGVGDEDVLHVGERLAVEPQEGRGHEPWRCRVQKEAWGGCSGRARSNRGHGGTESAPRRRGWTQPALRRNLAVQEHARETQFLATVVGGCGVGRVVCCAARRAAASPGHQGRLGDACGPSHPAQRNSRGVVASRADHLRRRRQADRTGDYLGPGRRVGDRRAPDPASFDKRVCGRAAAGRQFRRIVLRARHHRARESRSCAEFRFRAGRPATTAGGARIPRVQAARTRRPSAAE